MSDFFDHLTGHKALPTVLGLVGAAIALTYQKDPPGRRVWISSVLSAGTLAFVGTPVVAAAIRHYLDLTWLPGDGSVEGLLGLILGITGMQLVTGILTLVSTFAKDPVGTLLSIFNRLRGRK